MSGQRRNRRVHTCFLTENREYHVRAGVCIAVRDRCSLVWISGHKAIGMHLKKLPAGIAYVGRRLEFFSLEKEQLVKTSTVVDIMRPNKNEVDFYGFVHGFYPENNLAG